MRRLTVEAILAGEVMLRPPRRSLRLDVTLRSEWPSPLWVLLPDRTAGTPEQGPVRRVEIYDLNGAGVVALRGDGRGAFAVLLAAGGDASLRAVPLADWGDASGSLALVAVSVLDLRLDGQPPPGVAPLATGAVVDAAPLEDQRAVVRTLGGIGGPPVSFEGDSPQSVPVRVAPAPASPQDDSRA